MDTTTADRLGDAPSVDQIKEEIYNVLSEIHTGSSSSFACGGAVKGAQNPGLYLNDHGSIEMPLSKQDAETIISKSKQSPFGKGSETIVDTSIRKSWQLDPSQFSIRNPDWDQMLDNIVHDVYEGLSLDVGMNNVSVELYKLLLYEEGAFFKPHKDSEKAPGMFGTLVICLPSEHKGGELVLSFNGESKTIKTAQNPYFGMSYAAWYADVLHEVKPVTSGYRLVLTYNMIRRNVAGLGTPPTPLDDKADLVLALTKYNDSFQKSDNGYPGYFIHLLEHQYTQASLRRDLLKGKDLGQVKCLKEAATELGFGLYLASMEKEVLKTDDAYADQEERNERYCNGYYDEDDEDEDEEDFHRSDDGNYSEEEISCDISLQYIVNLDGSQVGEPKTGGYGIEVDEHALVDLAAYEEKDPDDEEHSGYTGNEGCTATFWYRDTVRKRSTNWH